VDVSIGDPEVRTLLVGTGEAGGGYPLGGSPPAFHLRPRTYGQRRWSSTQRGSGGETTSGAIVWGARLQQTVEHAALGPSSWGGRPKREPVKTPKQCQREEETDHEQEHEQRKDHTKPRCLKWGDGRASLEASIRGGYRTVKRLGEQPELSTTVNGCTRSMDSSFLRRKNKGPREGKSSD
jgi:hypothetical protein